NLRGSGGPPEPQPGDGGVGRSPRQDPVKCVFMTQKQWTLFVIPALMACTAAAQLPPGYVDPEPVLRAAARAIGTDNLKCVTIAGTGYSGAVGQQKESGWNIDWPRGEPLINYVRTMNWEAKTSKEEFDRKPGHN